MLCGEPFEDPAPPHQEPKSVQVDHVIQVWNGGTDTLDNLRLAHRRCNNRRQSEGLSPAQLRRDEIARARWTALVGKEKTDQIGTAIRRGDQEEHAKALHMMLAARRARKRL